MPLLSVLGMLLCTIAILVLAYWATRKIGLSGMGGLTAGGRMRVHDRLSLGQNQALLIVQIGERWFVLAVSRENVSTVAELSAEEAQAWQKETPLSQANSHSAAFMEMLSRKLHGKDDTSKRG